MKKYLVELDFNLSKVNNAEKRDNWIDTIKYQRIFLFKWIIKREDKKRKGIVEMLEVTDNAGNGTSIDFE